MLKNFVKRLRNYRMVIFRGVSLVLMMFIMQPCATVFYQPEYPQKLRGNL